MTKVTNKLYILYGVNGEGYGHGIRSMPIIKELKKDYKVIIVAGGKAYSYLSRYFSNIYKIGYLKLIVSNNKIRKILTLLYNLIMFPVIFIRNLKIIFLINKFKPFLTITDFEPFSHYLSLLFGIPSVCIDNQHIITNCRIKVKGNLIDKFISEWIIKLMIPKARYYLITSFFKTEVKKPNTYIFPPVLREEILKIKPKKKMNILVYQTYKSNKKLIPILFETNENFIVYGFNKQGKIKNIFFKSFNEDEFFNDLANCKAVITNGGFTLISEAIYLKKPILSIPVENQFEQILNAIYLERLRLGVYCKRLTKRDLEKFISKLDNHLKNFRNKAGNKEIITRLKNIINEIKA